MHPFCKILNTPVIVNMPSQTKWRNVGWKTSTFFIQRLQTFFSRFLTFKKKFLERFLHLWCRVRLWTASSDPGRRWLSWWVVRAPAGNSDVTAPSQRQMETPLNDYWHLSATSRVHCLLCMQLDLQLHRTSSLFYSSPRFSLGLPLQTQNSPFPPWKRCPSHVWRGLPLCQFWSS